MKNSVIKSVIRGTLFKDGATRRVRFGPLRGRVYRVSKTTGMSPWYSGPERDHQRLFKTLLQSGDAVVDAGANWGMHTLLFSSLVGKSGRVIAVEPSPMVNQELEWHVIANGCANVTVCQCALSDSPGEAMFAETASSYTSHLARATDPVGVNPEVRVKVSTLDDLIEAENLGRPKLVKIDVEGSESAVLSGAARTIAEDRPIFVIDLHTPEQDVRVANVLLRAHYDIRRVSGPPIVRFDAGWPRPDGVWGSIVARPL